jgi:hypothetical protein
MQMEGLSGAWGKDKPFLHPYGKMLRVRANHSGYTSWRNNHGNWKRIIQLMASLRGRKYTILVTEMDILGNAATKKIEIVPHIRGN